MSMHLVGPYLTTTKYNSKQKTSKSKKLDAAKAEHEAWLKKIGVGKGKLPVNKKGQRVGIYDIPDYKTGPRMTSDNVAGNGVAKEPMVYSGERQLLGIATMHKSNMVPVFADKKEDAKDIAQMRRN
jgi:hypothetical protein